MSGEVFLYTNEKNPVLTFSPINILHVGGLKVSEIRYVQVQAFYSMI